MVYTQASLMWIQYGTWARESAVVFQLGLKALSAKACFPGGFPG